MLKKGSREIGCIGWLTDCSIWAVDCGDNGKILGIADPLTVLLYEKADFGPAGTNPSNDDVYATDGRFLLDHMRFLY